MNLNRLSDVSAGADTLQAIDGRTVMEDEEVNGSSIIQSDCTVTTEKDGNRYLELCSLCPDSSFTGDWYLE